MTIEQYSVPPCNNAATTVSDARSASIQISTQVHDDDKACIHFRTLLVPMAQLFVLSALIHTYNITQVLHQHAGPMHHGERLGHILL